MGKMTLKELADRLDVSVSAISLAINGKPGLSDETRSRILAEVESVGYPLKERAEQFTKILLLFCKDSGSSRPGSTHGTDYIFMDLQQGVLDLASSENCVAAIQYWDVEKPLNLDSFRDYVGILLFNSPVLSLEKLDELLSCGIPLVLVDNVFPQRKVCSVSIDNEGGIISGLEWLFSQGCRRPAFVESQNGHMRRNEMERRETYRYWMREKGLTPMWMDLVRDKELQSFKKQMQELKRKPDALFFSSDYLAFSLLPLLSEFASQNGQSCKLIGFDNLVGRIPSAYTFSSVDIKSVVRGREALLLLLRVVRDKDYPCCHIRVGTQLVVRENKGEFPI